MPNLIPQPTTRRWLVLGVLFIVFFAGIGMAIKSFSHAATTTYQEDQTDFPNPERGFSQQAGDYLAARSKNMTLVHQYFRLDAYKTSALPDSYLQSVRETFKNARAAGIKVIPRFTYNFPATYPINPATDADASQTQIQAHITQLAPILQENADVIAYMEAGFIGAWGEWHSSTNGLINPTDKATVLNRLLAVLPASRSVAVRYERDKKAIFNRASSISTSEAYSGSAASRTGHINDCFLSSIDDTGTYDNDGTLPAQKTYLHDENQFLPQGGETCNGSSSAAPYFACTAALGDLTYQEWSQLNSEYEPGVLSAWSQQGCMTTIAKQLGYRFRLTASNLPDSLKPGSTYTGSFTVFNSGFASPYNPRKVELVLRNKGTGQEFALPMSDDPRRWAPGTSTNVSITAGVPATMPVGSYDAYLNFPDPMPNLYGRPEYSIRLANVGTWEAVSGYNSLLHSSSIASSASGTTYTGSQWFLPKASRTTPPAIPAVTPTPTAPAVTPTPATSPVSTIHGDLNGDRHVNILDLSLLLSGWGTSNTTTDINHDGTTNILDLSSLLSGWTG